MGSPSTCFARLYSKSIRNLSLEVQRLRNALVNAMETACEKDLPTESYTRNDVRVKRTSAKEESGVLHEVCAINFVDGLWSERM